MVDDRPPDTPYATSGPGAPAPPPRSAFMEQLGALLAPGRENVILIYVLYLLGLVPAFGLVPILVGFVMAVLNRDKAEALERTHYEFLFRQALIGLGLVIISLILIIILIGFVGFLLTAIWWVVRSVKGLLAINNREPIPDPRSWLW